MKKIPLTRGMFALVDDEDYEELSKHKWQALRGNSKWYASRHNAGGGSGQTLMHRQIFGLKKSLSLVDHRDGDGLNNQRYNLREATSSQNQQNKPVRRCAASRYKGIYWRRDRGCWVAEIKANGKKIYLGQFNVEREAAAAYNQAAAFYFGEFAYLNEGVA